MLYVKMEDDFLSGWGRAEGKRSVFCVRCKSSAEARQVMKAAHRRPEMKNIRQQLREPKDTEFAVVSMTDFNNLSGDWLL